MRKPKYLYWLAGLLVFIFFGDSILLFIGHLLHMLLEFISSILDHSLQSVFHLSKRHAQIAVFYIEFIVGAIVTWQLSLITCRKCMDIYRNTYGKLKQFLLESGWLRMTLLIATVSTALFLLT
jgi:hypothetical protein